MTYKEFIDNILKTRGRYGCGEEYHERHHIIPKCLGGANDEDNLIDLFAREHYEAHRLLALENPESRDLQLAWWCMTSMKNSNENERYICSPEDFEKARKNHSESLKGENNPMFGVHRYGELNPMYGKKHSDETKKKISKKAKANVRDWIDNPYIGKSRKGKDSPSYGIKRSKETRDKLSKMKKVHRKIVQYDKDGNYIKTFNSEWEASEELNISVPLIRYSLQKIGNTAKGYIFVLFNDINTPNHIDIPKRTRKDIKKVEQSTPSGQIICVYESIKEAANKTGADASCIIRCCKGLNKTAKGYCWKYVD